MLSSIDPPSRYHPTEDWQNYLAALRRSPQDDPLIRYLISQAEQELQRRQSLDQAQPRSPGRKTFSRDNASR